MFFVYSLSGSTHLRTDAQKQLGLPPDQAPNAVRPRRPSLPGVMSSSRTATRRLLKEVEALSKLQGDYEKGIERVGPISDDELFKWEAVINGQDVGFGYDGACSFFSLPHRSPFSIHDSSCCHVFFLTSPLMSYPKTLEHIANEEKKLTLLLQKAAGSSASRSRRRTRRSRPRWSS